MNKKRNLSLWLTFVLIVFFIMLLSAVIISVLAAIFIHMGFSLPFRQNPLFPIFTLLFTSTCIGTIFSMLGGNVLIKPIRAFSNATTSVAKGDFTIRVGENQTIYEIGEMAKNFNKMVAELSSIETLRNDFIASVSHEFKTPLSTIEGYVTLLQAEDLTQEQKQNYINIIMNSTSQLSALTSNILKLSKLEKQDRIIEKDWFSLDEVIRQSLLFLENKWAVKEIELELELASISFYGNEELMMQVFINLIDNAIKFTPSKGNILIHSFQTSKEVFISISDSGVGISKEMFHHIFEKFYQFDKSRLSEGNGLGLTLVKQIVDLSMGTIEVTSTLNVGTTFTLKFPNSSN